MKKVLLLSIVALCLGTAAKAQIRVGGFLGYASDIDQPAIGAIAEFMINDKMGISPNLTLYFPEKSGGVKFSYWELNGNFNYYFLDENSISLYGLAGLNFTTAKVKVDNNQFYDNYSNTELGINLGMGINVKASDKVLPFGELKYVVGDYDHLAIFFGVKFNLN